MVKVNVYDGDGRVMESVDLSEVIPLNDPSCPHTEVKQVEDSSGIPGVTAYQCMICPVGWLIKDKINEEK